MKIVQKIGNKFGGKPIKRKKGKSFLVISYGFLGFI